MKRLILTLTFCLAVVAAPGAFAQERDVEVGGRRLAQTGMKFLQISVNPRAAALGDAVTAQEMGSDAMFYNPAGMARLQGTASLAAGQVQWIGEYKYHHVSAAFQPASGRYGVVGVTVVAADYGNLIGTIRADNERGFEDTGTFSPSAFAVGLGYAKALTDRFAVGGNAKYVRQSLGAAVLGVGSGGRATEDNALGTVAFDFGVLYKTGFESLNFAIAARNFSQELSYVRENFELPLTFSIGLSMDMMDLVARTSDDHAFVLAVDAQRHRDYDEQVRIGGEYVFMDILSLRAGYAYPADEQGINLGAGLQTDIRSLRFGFDYTYTSFGILGNVNRLGVQVAF